MTENAKSQDTHDHSGSAQRFSPTLLIAGAAALAIALWGAVGGPNLITAGVLLAVLAIGAVAVAGVMLIARPHGRGEKKQRATD